MLAKVNRYKLKAARARIHRIIPFPDRYDIRREAADSAVACKAKQQHVGLIWKWNKSKNPSPNPRTPLHHPPPLNPTSSRQRQIHNIRRRLRHQQHHFLEAQPQHPQSLSRTTAYINHPATNERAAVSDADIYLAAIDQAVYPNPGAKRQGSVGSGKCLHVVAFAAGGAPAMKAGAVPRRATSLVLACRLPRQQSGARCGQFWA